MSEVPLDSLDSSSDVEARVAVSRNLRPGKLTSDTLASGRVAF